MNILYNVHSDPYFPLYNYTVNISVLIYGVRFKEVRT